MTGAGGVGTAERAAVVSGAAAGPALAGTVATAGKTLRFTSLRDHYDEQVLRRFYDEVRSGSACRTPLTLARPAAVL